MGVMFTAEAEKKRQQALQDRKARKSTRWEFLITTSLVEALHYARDHGWADKQVQVKAYKMNDSEFEYAVEPFEHDCKCPNLLHFEDYFDREPQKEAE